MTSLPPVTSGRPPPRGGAGMAPLEAPQDRGTDHPFDTPFTIMQNMQAELIKLREDLRLEQHERKTEVASLKNEIQELREVIRRDEMKEQVDTDRLQAALRELGYKEENDWQTTRQDMEAEFARRTLVDDTAVLSSRVDKNTADIQKVNQEFIVTLRDLQELIDKNSQGDNEFAQAMQKELIDQRSRLDKNAENDQVFEETVVAQLRMAGHLLQAAGCKDRIPVAESAAGGTSCIVGDGSGGGVPPPPK